MKKAIIGVDAGGSSTKLALFLEDGKIVKKLKAKAGSSASVKSALENVEEGILQLYDAVKDEYDVQYIVIGLSGLKANSKEALDKLVSNLEMKTNLEVSLNPDTLIALYSFLKDKYEEGIVVISGTGHASFGLNKEGKSMMIGGWGYMIYEIGSAFSAVQDLIIKSVRHYEEEGEIYPLAEKLIKEIGLSSIDDLRVFMYHNDKKTIASFAYLVTEEAKNNDKLALEILDDASIGIVRSIKLLVKHLGLKETAVLGFTGEYIKNSQILQNLVLEKLKKEKIKLEYIEDSSDPIYGAYYLAKKKGKIWKLLV